MKVLAIIPARGGSKGVPRKNIRLVAGKPLIAYSIAAALGSSRLDRIFVSTDSEEIALVARDHGAAVRMRPAALAEDHTSTLAVLQHHVRELAAEGYAPDAVMTLQPTSPLRTSRHIDDAIAQFAADTAADSLVSCIAVPHIFHPRSVMQRDADGYLEPFLGETGPTRRQEKEAVFARNGAAVYITRTPQLAHYVFGGRLLPFAMSEADSLDIDTEDDLAAADRLLAARALP